MPKVLSSSCLRGVNRSREVAEGTLLWERGKADGDRCQGSISGVFVENLVVNKPVLRGPSLLSISSSCHHHPLRLSVLKAPAVTKMLSASSTIILFTSRSVSLWGRTLSKCRTVS
jgi:hypothetical protein